MTATTVGRRLFPAVDRLQRDTVSGLLRPGRFCWLISAITHKAAGGRRPSPRFAFNCQAGRRETGLAADDGSCQQQATFHKVEDRKLQHSARLEWTDARWEGSGV